MYFILCNTKNYSYIIKYEDKEYKITKTNYRIIYYNH